MPDVTRPVTTSMLVNNLFFVLACSVHSVSGRCRWLSYKPRITVANSTHLRVNWENSLSEECDDGEAKSAHLRIRHNLSNSFKFKNDRIPVNFDDKQVDVKADPCLTHTRIRVELEYGSTLRDVISLDNSYNPLLCSNIRPWALYSGPVSYTHLTLPTNREV